MPQLISVGQVIDQSWDFFTKHFQTLMKISLWSFVISIVWIIGTIFAPIGDPALSILGGFTAAEGAGIIIMALASFPIAPIISVWILVTLMMTVAPLVAGKKVNAREMFKGGWKMFVPYVWVALLKGLVLLLPALLLVPGIVLIFVNASVEGGAVLGAISVLLTFAGALAGVVISIMLTIELNFIGFELILENNRGGKALSASRALVKGRFWKTFWRLIIPKLVFYFGGFLVQAVLMVLFSVLLATAASMGDETVLRISNMFAHVISIATVVLVTPIVVLADYLVFDSLRKNR
ncbi:MAG: hypothetical protein ABIA47_00035 [bacterium]